jgi:uncharacterized protein (TIGR03067 family)
MITGYLPIVVGLMFATDSKDDAAKQERAKLQGVWAVVAIETDGNRAAPARAMKWTIKDNHITQSIVNVAGAVREFSFDLDPSTDPKMLDLTYEDSARKGEKIEGIYELKDDELRICLNFAPKAAPRQRPTEFETKSNTNFSLRIMRREKP